MPPKRRRYGEGSIYRRGAGWAGQTLVLATDGTRRRLTVYGPTRKDVSDKLSAAVADDRAGRPRAMDSQTVGEYLNYWLEHVAQHSVRGSTYKSYEMYVRRHLVPGLGRHKLTELSARDIRVFLDGRRMTPVGTFGRGNRTLSQTTLKHIHSVLRNALQHAVREDLVTRNVARNVQISTGPRATPDPYTLDEARQLLAAASSDRHYALYSVALGLGLRRGEVTGLRWQDIDLDACVLRVEQTLQHRQGGLHVVPPKTRRSRRALPLPQSLVDVLREHRAQHEPVTETDLAFINAWGNPVSPNELTKGFVELCKKAGLRRIRLHDLRHTCATFLLADGVPPRVVMVILGHSSMDMTMNVYGHVTLDLQKTALDGIDALLTREGDVQPDRPDVDL